MKIIRKCPTCSLNNQASLPVVRNTKCKQINEIWQVDMVNFACLDNVYMP